MHNYTIPNRYVSQTRMGNWFEEEALKEYHFKDYLKTKQVSNLISTNNQEKVQFSLQPRDISKCQNNQLRYGSSISFYHYKTDAFLSFNIYQKITGDQAYSVTTGKNTYPCLRNVFTIQHLQQENNTDIIRYGDKFRLVSRVNNELKLYLQSVPLSPTRCSKFLKYQQVSVTQVKNSNTIWNFQNINPKLRFEAKGQVVNIENDVLLKHAMTGQWLGSDTVADLNEFGNQYEVFAKSILANFKTQNLYAQKVGHISVEVPLRDQHSQNDWKIVSKK